MPPPSVPAGRRRRRHAQAATWTKGAHDVLPSLSDGRRGRGDGGAHGLLDGPRAEEVRGASGEWLRQRTAGDGATLAQAPVGRFWQGFNDSGLDSLVNRALQANTDLRIAFGQPARSAGAAQRFADAQLFPTVDLTAGAGRARAPDYQGNPQSSNAFSVGFDVRWESGPVRSPVRRATSHCGRAAGRRGRPAFGAGQRRGGSGAQLLRAARSAGATARRPAIAGDAAGRAEAGGRSPGSGPRQRLRHRARPRAGAKHSGHDSRTGNGAGAHALPPRGVDGSAADGARRGAVRRQALAGPEDDRAGSHRHARGPAASSPGRPRCRSAGGRGCGACRRGAFVDVPAHHAGWHDRPERVADRRPRRWSGVRLQPRRVGLVEPDRLRSHPCPDRRRQTRATRRPSSATSAPCSPRWRRPKARW